MRCGRKSPDCSIGYVPDGPRIRPMRGIARLGRHRQPVQLRSKFLSTSRFRRSRISPSPPPPIQASFWSVVARRQPDYSVRRRRQSRHADPEPRWHLRRSLVPLERTSANRERPARRSFGPNYRRVSFLNASPLALAVSDDGQWSAGLFSAGVYAFGPNAEVSFLCKPTRASLPCLFP